MFARCNTDANTYRHHEITNTAHIRPFCIMRTFTLGVLCMLMLILSDANNFFLCCNLMSKLQCLGKSCTGSLKQLAVEVASAHDKTQKPIDAMGEKTFIDKTSCPPGCTVPGSVQVYGREPQKSGSGGVLNTAGERTHAPPPVEPVPAHELNEEEDAEDEDLNAPVELKIEFLRALMNRDFQLASKLCQMILIHEPDNPEASEFVPLLQRKLLEEREAEQSNEEDEEEASGDEDVDADDNSGSDEESSQSSSSSSSSCSSSSPSDDEDEQEDTQVNRHKPGPPSHISP